MRVASSDCCLGDEDILACDVLIYEMYDVNPFTTAERSLIIALVFSNCFLLCLSFELFSHLSELLLLLLKLLA